MDYGSLLLRWLLSLNSSIKQLLISIYNEHLNLDRLGLEYFVTFTKKVLGRQQHLKQRRFGCWGQYQATTHRGQTMILKRCTKPSSQTQSLNRHLQKKRNDQMHGYIWIDPVYLNCILKKSLSLKSTHQCIWKRAFPKEIFIAGLALNLIWSDIKSSFKEYI